METCEYQYFLGYVQKRKAPWPGKVAAGVGFHKAIARAFQAKKDGTEIPTIDQLLNVAKAEMSAWEEREGVIWDEAPNDQATLITDVRAAIHMVFLELFEKIEPWGVEQGFNVTVKFPDREKQVTGYIDLIENDASHTIVDWKLAQRASDSSEPDVEHIVYALWHQAQFGVEATPFRRIQFVRLKAGIKVHDSLMVVSKADVDWFLRHVLYERIRHVEEGSYAANTKSCGWCRFKEQCRPKAAIAL